MSASANSPHPNRPKGSPNRFQRCANRTNGYRNEMTWGNEDIECRMRQVEADIRYRAERQDELAHIVETIVRSLEAGCRLIATSLHDLPVSDRERAHPEGTGGRSTRVSGLSGSPPQL